MKYGETIFDIAYLLFAIISGILILKKQNDDVEQMMGRAVLFLGVGDAFHLIPRIMNYFSKVDVTSLLGIGKFTTSITMTIFYIFIYHIYMEIISKKRRNKKLTLNVYLLALVRIILLLLPQNNWMENNSPLYISIIRNIPFILLGAIIIYLYFKDRSINKEFKNLWLYMLLSFLFYIPVVLLSGTYPIIGMLMIPKTFCYVLIIHVFNKFMNSKIR